MASILLVSRRRLERRARDTRNLRCGAVRLTADPPAADPAIEALVRTSSRLGARAAPGAALPGLLQRVQERAAAERVPFEDGYKFGDVSKTVLEATRGEATRLDTGGTCATYRCCCASASSRGRRGTDGGRSAAMPVAALLATYGAALKLELGGRAVQEVTVRVGERAARASPTASSRTRGRRSISLAT